MTNEAFRQKVQCALDMAQQCARELKGILTELDMSGAPVADESDLLISTGAAAKIAGLQKDTIRHLCEEKGIGLKRGGRWKVSVPLLKKYLGE